MATQVSLFVADNSTLVNYTQWAGGISTFLGGNGWVQADDPGQIVWTATVLTLTQIAVAGGNATYSYSSYTGPAPRKGMCVSVTGFATSGNNVATSATLSGVTVAAGVATWTYSSYTGPVPSVGQVITVTGFVTTPANNATGLPILSASGGASGTFTTPIVSGQLTESHAGTATAGVLLTSVSGGSSGTVIVATTTQANETHAGSGTTTALASPPGISAFFSEIWKSAGTEQTTCPIFFKIEYGAGSTQTFPATAITVASGTNGLGTVTNGTSRTLIAGAATEGATQRTCCFAGDGTKGRLGIMMWTDAGAPSVRYNFVLERSLNSSGVVTADYFTWCFVAASVMKQRTWLAGQAPSVELTFASAINASGLVANSGTYGASTYYSPVYPLAGSVGNPMTMCGAARGIDINELVTFPVTMYGSGYTMKPTKQGFALSWGDNTGSNGAFVMGWY